MKKVLISFALLVGVSVSAEAAIQTFSASDTGGVTRSKLNSNFSELDTTKETKAVVQASAPADTSVDWYDTDQEAGVLILKRHNGTTWVRASSHGVQYAASCATITGGMCVDTDDGKLYYHNGTAVVEVGTGGSGTTYTAGTGIDITSGVISSTVTGTLPPGIEGQGLQKGASAWEAVDLAPLAFTDNVSRNSSTGVVSVPVTTTATSGSAVPFTSGGAYTALGGKQDTLVSGTNIKTINSTSILGSGNIDIAGGTGGGLTSTLSSAPYSDVSCTADGVYNHNLYKCVDDGTGTGYFTEYVATTAYLNPTPVDTTPDAFSFTDVTNAALSTEYTALAQINGIAAGITCSGYGGTVAACTGSTSGTCGTFGATSGSITNGQYVGAKVTSSVTASTPANNVVTCGGVNDTYTVTTSASWNTAWSIIPNGSTTDGQYRQWRNVIPANSSSYSGTKVRVTIKAGGGASNGVIGGVSIGQATSTYVYDSTPTRLTFAGSNGVSVSPNSEVTTDEIDFTFDRTKRHIVHVYTSARNFVTQSGAASGSLYYDFTTNTDQSMITAPANAYNAINEFAGIIKIEVLP